MKKCIVLLMAFLFGITKASAQDRADISLNGSVLAMNSATNSGITRGSSTTGGALASFRFWLTPRNGFEFNYGHAGDTQTVTTTAGKTSLDAGVREVSGAYVFRLTNASHVQPFFGAGVALLQFNPSKNSTLIALPQSQNKPGVLYFAGFDYVFNRHFSARVQFRGLVFAAPSYMNETFRSNTMHQMSEPTFGFVYRF